MNRPFKNNLHEITQTTIAISISIATIVCALLLSVEVFELTKGRNYSDVGIPVYTHFGRAFILSILTYITITIIVFYSIWLTLKWKWFIYIYGVVNFFAFIMVLFPLLLMF